MQQATTILKYNTVNITSLDGKKSIDLTANLVQTDYFEDLLEPCVSAQLSIVASYDIVEGLPIRGGEKVIIDLETYSGPFKQEFFVYKVSDTTMAKQKSSFILHLVPVEYATNEFKQVGRKFQNIPIDIHVRDILTDILQTKKIGVIENTSNSISFFGNLRKPFYLLRWLGPKSESTAGTGSKGEDSSKNDDSKDLRARGTAGFIFYQNRDGFHFRSIDSLASKTRVQFASADEEKVFTYTTGEVIKAGEDKNPTKIIQYFFEKNIDVRKSLRVGMYANRVTNFSPKTHQVSSYTYDLKEELGSEKLGKESDITTPSDLLQGRPTRNYFTISDEGVHSSSGAVKATQSRTVDARSHSRYNLLFTQGLNILVPCNVQLKVGDIIRCIFNKVEGGSQQTNLENTSGLYLIKELRHHFSANQNTTSLKLVRDSYGLQ